jgi:hypothetical protein
MADKDLRCFRHIKTGVVKLAWELEEMYKSPFTREETMFYFEVETPEDLPRGARRAYARKKFKKEFGTKKW